ncbi:type II toxin-antitoxin system RelE/ParE family toxin [Xaviernesmea oryzae]|uniref:type II toxin-antitoxin system RelE/ParE family toxin n=1 Tax=Xaviernesmea oryzae TaxID=464029 RepID=UPI00094FFC5E|nr:type II toxin-antitoxin system RelE/ParE family toxin [Xaviernesmea oryzae]
MKRIYLDIGRVQPEAAERYFRRFRDKAERLRDHPLLGRSRPDIFPTARMLVEAPYLILYETVFSRDDDDVERVEIVRVVDGRRDLQDLFP